MSSAVTTEINATECLAAAGLPASEVKAWLQAEPGETTDFPTDREKFSEYWRTSARLLGRLPQKARRNASEHAAATYIDVYEKVTGREFALPDLSVAPLARVRANLKKYFEKAA